MVLHSGFRSALSIALVSGLGVVALTGMVFGAAAHEEAQDYTDKFVGRWTMQDEDRPLTGRAQPYKTFDIVECGKDLCGMSVNAAGKCDTVLFRIAAYKTNTSPTFHGVSRWSSKDVDTDISIYKTEDKNQDAQNRSIALYIGRQSGIQSRVASMPLFTAGYKSVGKAMCPAP